MKRSLLLAVLPLCVLAQPAHARDIYVRGYTRSDGAYVQPHYRSAPDESSMNNYSSWGNINPYTGKEGSAFPPPPPYRPYPAPAYENPYADRNPYDPAR